ncbi:MAG TPA: hypothetical protein VJ761_23605 [Ktedonobacteraceae bacterium]|nr:hypothetical protein [Ktedonobacteraceae bacterium]
MTYRNEHNQAGEAPDAHNRDQNRRLAQWLQELLAAPPGQVKTVVGSSDESGRLAGNYHPGFYKQLPDFIMALLKNDSQASLRYAPLIYHLIGCSTCHTAYLEMYAAMQAAVQPELSPIEVDVDEETFSMVTVPAREIAFLCEQLIEQAGDLLYQARHEHTDNTARARVLLQQAIYISLYIKQNTLRQNALRNLVDVAALAQDAPEPLEQSPAAHTFVPLVGAGNGSRSTRVLRGTHTLERPENQQAIYLQSGMLSGIITQHENTLELHLIELGEELRGHYVNISILLGTLLEPVRWYGGNPRAIRSQAPVDQRGALTTPLGETDLRLSRPEDRYLLEAIFKKIDLRPAD